MAETVVITDGDDAGSSPESVDHAIDRAVDLEGRITALEHEYREFVGRIEQLMAETRQDSHHVVTEAVDAATVAAAEVAASVAEDVVDAAVDDVVDAVDDARDAADAADDAADADEDDAAGEGGNEDISPHRKHHWYDRPWSEWKSKE